MVRNEIMYFGVEVCKCGDKCGFNLQDIRAQGIIEREKKINSLRRTVRKEKRRKFKLC